MFDKCLCGVDFRDGRMAFPVALSFCILLLTFCLHKSADYNQEEVMVMRKA